MNASQKQLDYINTLLVSIRNQQMDYIESYKNDPLRDFLALEARAKWAILTLIDIEAAQLTTKEASELIDILKMGHGDMEKFILMVNGDIPGTILTDKIAAAMPHAVEAVQENAEPVYTDRLTVPSFRDVEQYLIEIGEEYEWDVIPRKSLDDETYAIERQLIVDIAQASMSDNLQPTHLNLVDLIPQHWPRQYGVTEAAKMAEVSPRYVQAEIKAGRLKAELVQPEAGRSYYRIKSEDFEMWRVNPQRGQRGARAKKDA